MPRTVYANIGSVPMPMGEEITREQAAARSSDPNYKIYDWETFTRDALAKRGMLTEEEDRKIKEKANGMVFCMRVTPPVREGGASPS